MLLKKETACLLIVDVQEKLTPHVLNHERLIHYCQWLMRLASELDVPFLVCEHYTKGLGPTVESLQKFMPGPTEINKVHFSCFKDLGFLRQFHALNKRQVVIAGIETHVCVLQTALDLKEAGFDVFVVVNAVSARHHFDHDCALKRMAHAGIQLMTSEMVFFEWVEQADTAVFKALSQAFLK